jgi:DNA-binding transcriptional MocR family regulator
MSARRRRAARHSPGAASSRSARSAPSTARCARSRVTAPTPASSPSPPALDLFPLDTVRAITERVLRRGAAAVGLGPTEGQPRLRRALAQRAGVRPEQVLVTTGAQQALDLIARCLLDPGDAVIIDRPGYLGAIQVFRAAGATLVGWDIQRADPGELEDLLLRYRPKLLFTNPTFSNPTGRTLTLPERRDLLDLAARYRLPVVEDDLYRDLSFGAPSPPALRTLDEHGLVIGVNTVSKTLAAGLRVGWVIAPEAIVDQLAIIKGRADVASASLEQLIVAELLVTRAYDEHLTVLRAAHRARHDALAGALRRHLPPGALAFGPVDGGMYLWCRAGLGIDARELLEEATVAGVVFVNGEVFYPDSSDGAGRRELRFCFSACPPERIDDDARRLARAFAALRERAGQAEGMRVLV